MRLAMYKCQRAERNQWRLGALVHGNVLDLALAAHAYTNEHRSESPLPVAATIVDVLRGGDDALHLLRRVHEWAQGAAVDVPQMLYPLGECVLDAPLRPGKLITLARNYHEHVAEHGLTHTGKVPSASIKASSSLTGPHDDIVRPAVETQ